MKLLFTIIISLLTIGGFAQTFTMAGKGKCASVMVSDNDYEGVKIAAENLRKDILLAYEGKITGANGLHVIIGTIGHSAGVDSLVSAGAVDVDEVKGSWERYVIDRCGNDLVIAGSDRRGTIYGIYELSRRMGVSAWTWWADIPVVRQKSVVVKAGRYVKPSPSVKYRGIFINDEDWGMKPWATNNFEKELGDIGPKTYEKVCELILRLGGNMLAPAMHSCTGAFYTHKESKVVADRLGVIITTSHCEPMLFNNASEEEWNAARDGEWNYRTNRNTILGKFANRMAEASHLDNIYTIAMRGVHDEGMQGQKSAKDRVAVLEDVISDQRNLIEMFTQRKASEVPQIFVPYKETLDVYDAGLKLPDDVTIVWPDDNYGFMKRLPNASERKRSGGSGVYYHLSYLGTPHDYLWLCTTPPVLMYEELKKAYDAGADRYWLLNVGDIKPMEMSVQLFFEMADHFGSFDYVNVNRAQYDMIARWFPQIGNKNLVNSRLLDEYYRLAWIRKPEYMGWDWQWDSPDKCRLRDTEFSFENYNDAQQRIADYHRIAGECRRVMDALKGDARWAYFEVLGYPVMAAEQMNRKFLFAQLNHEMYEKKQYAEANWAARQSQAAADSIEALCKIYNTMLNGKWNGMMMVPPGFVSLYQNMPNLYLTEGVDAREVDLGIKKEKNIAKGYSIVDLKAPKASENVRIIDGLGYDWVVAQFGEAGKEGASSAEYNLGAIDADEVTVHLHALPFFPVNVDKSNRISISVDGGEVQVLENKFEEWGASWKEQVMKNGFEFVTKHKVDTSRKTHILKIEGVDNGQIVERVVADWGGLKKSYLGPSMKR